MQKENSGNSGISDRDRFIQNIQDSNTRHGATPGSKQEIGKTYDELKQAEKDYKASQGPSRK